MRWCFVNIFEEALTLPQKWNRFETVKEAYCPDILHAWHLGPLGDYAVDTIWYLIIYVFKPESLLLEAGQEYRIALLRLKQELWPYYKERYRLDPDWKKKGAEVHWAGTDI